MKKDIHPKYFNDAKATCGCGKVFMLGSTQELTEVEICSNCHPFYTGKERIVDSAGKVEKFKAKRDAAAKAPKKEKKVRKKKEEDGKTTGRKSVVGKKKAKKVAKKKKVAPKKK